MKYLFLTLLLALPALCLGQTYERHYKITSNNDKVGYLIARQKVEGDMTHYELISQVDTRLLIRINLDTEIHSSYENGVLQYSSSTTYLNGNVHTNTEIIKQDGSYMVRKDEHSMKIFESEILLSASKLYFNEPGEEAKLISESEGVIKQLEKTGDKKYTLTTSGNKNEKSVYTYSSDQGLYQIEVQRAHLPDIRIKRVRNANEPED